MKLLIGMALGGLAAWLYGSDRVRRGLQHQFASAPESTQQLRQTVATAAASGAWRISEAIDSAPVADRVKDAPSEAAFNVWAAAEELGQTAPEAELAQDADAPTDA
jgi:hypothetical protein